MLLSAIEPIHGIISFFRLTDFDNLAREFNIVITPPATLNDDDEFHMILWEERWTLSALIIFIETEISEKLSHNYFFLREYSCDPTSYVLCEWKFCTFFIYLHMLLYECEPSFIINSLLQPGFMCWLYTLYKVVRSHLSTNSYCWQESLADNMMLMNFIVLSCCW